MTKHQLTSLIPTTVGPNDSGQFYAAFCDTSTGHLRYTLNVLYATEAEAAERSYQDVEKINMTIRERLLFCGYQDVRKS